VVLAAGYFAALDGSWLVMVVDGWRAALWVVMKRPVFALRLVLLTRQVPVATLLTEMRRADFGIFDLPPRLGIKTTSRLPSPAVGRVTSW
jgi:hypothetical protein